jgi:hypothetical protein
MRPLPIDYSGMKKLIFVALLFTFSLSSFAQPKYEKESRIRKSQVPQTAIQFVDSLTPDSRVVWYRETGYNKTSYEAKTRYKGKSLSIEFSDQGHLEDVEAEIKTPEIPPDTFLKISKLLTEIYGKYSFERMQLQYSGDPQSILAFLRNPTETRAPLIYYELVVAARSGGSYGLFEYLFSEEGVFIEKSEVLIKMTDNLEF